MKKIYLILLVCLTLTACFPEKQGTQSDHIKVVIADRTFKIPRGYLDGRKAIGKDTESIVLEYSLPNFEVLPLHPQEREARKKLINQGNMRSMLLENASKRPPIDMMAGNHMRNRDVSLVNNNLYNLEKYEYGIPEGKYAFRVDDILLEKDDGGEVISFLRCSPPNQDKIPACRHKFIDKGVLYEIGWRIQELPNWRIQRDEAIKFIDNFEAKYNRVGE